MRANTVARLWAQAEAFGADFNGSPCLCLPHKTDKKGYVRVRVGDRKKKPAQVVFYEAFIGPVPEGHELDHRCASMNGLRACANPWHMEPVTHKENVLRGQGLAAINARKTHCKRGHALVGENLHVRQDERYCKACRRLANKASWQATLAARKAKKT